MLERSRIQCCTDFFHYLIIEVQIVHDRQTHGQHLPCHKQMAEIGPGEGTAHRAVALRVNGLIVVLILLILYILLFKIDWSTNETVTIDDAKKVD